MPTTGAPANIWYPDTTTPIAPFENLFLQLATSVNTAFSALRRLYVVSNLAALDALSTAQQGEIAFMTTPGTGITPLYWQAVAGSGAGLDWQPLGDIVAATRGNLDTFIAAVAAITDTTFTPGSKAFVTGTGVTYVFTSTAGVYRPLNQDASANVLAVSGTGVSLDPKTGLITLAAAASPVIQFTDANWEWAEFVFDVACSSGSPDLIFNFRSGLAGANLATATYLYNLIEQSIAGTATRDSSGGDVFAKVGQLGTGRAVYKVTVYNSMLAQPKTILVAGGDSNGQVISGYNRQPSTTAYDTINPRTSSGATLTGTVRVTLGGVM